MTTGGSAGAADGVRRGMRPVRASQSTARLLALMLAAIGGAAVPASPHASSTGQESVATADVRLDRFEFRRLAMGSEARLVLHAPDEPRARHAAIAAFAEIEAVEQALSDWRESSEVRQVEARLRERPGEPVTISEVLASCLQRSLDFSQASDGAFDVTIAPAVSLWRTARRAGAMPPEEARREAISLVGHRRVALQGDPPTSVTAPPGTRFDFGGIGKGFGADRALEVLRRHGFPRAIVELGGDFAVGEPPPDAEGWRVEVRTGPGDERIVLVLRDCGVATSGDLQQFAEIDGVRYSHLVDPRTGLGLTSSIASTVIARDGAAADALATAMCVLGAERAGGVLERLDASARIVTRSLGEPAGPAVVVTLGDWP